MTVDLRASELDFAAIFAHRIRGGGVSDHFTSERLKSLSRLAFARVNQPCCRIR